MSLAIAFIIITKNEADNLPACLETLYGIPADIFVVDSGSIDDTVSIARNFGATVMYHEWTNHATQVNWAIDHIGTRADWIMRLDADERLTPELRDFILHKTQALPADVTGILIPRRTRFLGRWIRHGGLYPIRLLRLWRNGVGRCEERWMDEHMTVLTGRVIQIDGDLWHDISNDTDEWLKKHIGYAGLEFIDLSSDVSGATKLRGQSAVRQGIKARLYGHSPIFARAVAYWLFRYFVLLGFLDGPEGFVYHFLQGFWYRILIDVKVHEHRIGRRAINY